MDREGQILSDLGEIKGTVKSIESRQDRLIDSIYTGPTAVNTRLQTVEKKISWMCGLTAGIGSVVTIAWTAMKFWETK